MNNKRREILEQFTKKEWKKLNTVADGLLDMYMKIYTRCLIEGCVKKELSDKHCRYCGQEFKPTPYIGDDVLKEFSNIF